MAELSIEAIAILCYTAIALFLSLYFVPFKIVPRAWAKAVETDGHPAKAALDKVLDRAVAKIVFPKAAAGLEAKVDATITAFNAMVPTIQSLTPEKLRALMDAAIADHYKAGKARGDGGGGAPPALEAALDDVGWAVEHPEQAQALAIAHSSIDSAAAVFNWDEKKVKKLHGQANDAKDSLDQVRGLIERLQKLQASMQGHGGQSAGGGGRSGGNIPTF